MTSFDNSPSIPRKKAPFWKRALKIGKWPLSVLAGLELVISTLPAIDIYKNREYDPREKLGIEQKTTKEDDVKTFVYKEFAKDGIPRQYVNGATVIFDDYSFRSANTSRQGGFYDDGTIEINGFRVQKDILKTLIYELGRRNHHCVLNDTEREFANKKIIEYKTECSKRQKENAELQKKNYELHEKVNQDESKLSSQEREEVKKIHNILIENEEFIRPLSSALSDSETDLNTLYAVLFSEFYNQENGTSSAQREGIRERKDFLAPLFPLEQSNGKYNARILIPDSLNAYPSLWLSYNKQLVNVPRELYLDYRDKKDIKRLEK